VKVGRHHHEAIGATTMNQRTSDRDPSTNALRVQSGIMWLSTLILDDLELGFPPCVAGKGCGLGELLGWQRKENLPASTRVQPSHRKVAHSSMMRPIAEYVAHVGHEGLDCDYVSAR